jgi:hypothetical protein
VSGGTVSLSGGPIVQVPPGALSNTETLTLTRSTTQAPSGAVTPVFQFEASGAKTFAIPVTVTFPVANGTTAASIYWTKPGSTTEYDVLPTTITSTTTSTTATAQVMHFSSGYVGPAASGTWTGTWTSTTAMYTSTPPGGVPGSPVAVRIGCDSAQTGSSVTFTTVNDNGTTHYCAGTVSGTTLAANCFALSFDHKCTASYTRTATVDVTSTPFTATHDYSWVWEGSSCSGAGATITVQGAVFNLEPSLPLNIAGAWSGAGTYTNTGPGRPTVNGSSGSYTKTRTQIGSAVTSTKPQQDGSLMTCLGPIIENTIYAWCSNSGANGCTNAGFSNGTVNTSATPWTITGTLQSTLSGNCGGYTAETATAVETKN